MLKFSLVQILWDFEIYKFNFFRDFVHFEAPGLVIFCSLALTSRLYLSLAYEVASFTV